MESKARHSGRGQDQWLEVSQVDEAKQSQDLHLGGEGLSVLVERARPQRYYEVPCPVATYDRLHVDGLHA